MVLHHETRELVVERGVRAVDLIECRLPCADDEIAGIDLR
jgi:hypothetical protein